MGVSKGERKLLSLTRNEVRLLRTLEKLKTASMQDLADHLKSPRTSLYWPLTQLYERNLVAYKKVGKRKRWYSRMGEIPLRKKLGSIESVAGNIRVVEGLAQLKELYNTALDLHATERVLILEGNMAARSIAQRGGIAFMTSWHERAHKQKIIVESVLGAKVYNDLLRQAISPQVVKSLARWDTWIAHIVPDEWINVDAAVVIFRDVAILADWTKAHAILINTPEIVSLLKNFCTVFQLTGRKVDIVAEVRRALAETA